MTALKVLFVASATDRWRDLERRLRGEGRDVGWAKGTPEAVQAVLTEDVAAILTDDESCDPAFVRNVRQIRPDLPVILLTDRRRLRNADDLTVIAADERMEIVADTILHLVEVRRLGDRLKSVMSETRRLCEELRIRTAAPLQSSAILSMGQCLAILIPETGVWKSPFRCPLCDARLVGERRSVHLTLTCAKHGPVLLADVEALDPRGVRKAVLEAVRGWEEKIRMLQGMAEGAWERGREHIAASFAQDALEAQRRVERVLAHLYRRP